MKEWEGAKSHAYALTCTRHLPRQWLQCAPWPLLWRHRDRHEAAAAQRRGTCSASAPASALLSPCQAAVSNGHQPTVSHHAHTQAHTQTHTQAHTHRHRDTRSHTPHGCTDTHFVVECNSFGHRVAIRDQNQHQLECPNARDGEQHRAAHKRVFVCSVQVERRGGV